MVISGYFSVYSITMWYPSMVVKCASEDDLWGLLHRSDHRTLSIGSPAVQICMTYTAHWRKVPCLVPDRLKRS